MILVDPAAERAVLAGVCKFGADAYFDVADILSENTFTDTANQIIFKCVKSLIEDDNNSKIDVPSIYSAAHRLELDYIFKKTEEVKHLQAIMVMPIHLANVRKMAGAIRKLEIARLLHDQLGLAQDQILEVKGTEPIAEILGIAENSIFDFTSLLNSSHDDEPQRLGQDLVAHLEYLASNPVQQMGISSGWAAYDATIGGGFRDATLNMLAARPGVGKTTLARNIGNHISKNVEVPVLYLDTEMIKEDQQYRLMALLAEVPIEKIETGQFGSNAFAKKRVLEAAKQQEKIPFFYKNISGKPFEEVLSIARRWIMKEVGVNDDGTAKKCVIIYDYLKLMSGEELSGNLQEYQLLGFMTTGLHNFAVRYRIPIVAFIQLNRDGITKETSDAASGSDRIIWLVSNFTIYKPKSEEEIAEDGHKLGNRKLVVIKARHGKGSEPGNYINMLANGEYGRVVEGKTAFEARKDGEGFVTDEYNDEEETIEFE